MFKAKRLFISIFLLLHIVAIAKPTDSLRVELRDGIKYIIHRAIKGETALLLAKRYHVQESDIFSSNPLVAADVKPNQIILVPLNTSVYGDVKPAVIAPVVEGTLPLATSLPPPLSTDNNTVISNNANAESGETNKLQQTQKTPVEATSFSGRILRKEVNGNDTFIIYQVGPESSVTEVAKKFNVTDNAIKDYNNLESIVLIKDQIIRILIGTKKYDTNDMIDENKKAQQKNIEIEKKQQEQKQKQAMLAEKYPYTIFTHNKKEAVSYTVLEYDNLKEIADYFNTTPEAIKKTNKLTTNKISPGTNLIIEPGKEFFDAIAEPTQNPAAYRFDRSEETKKQQAMLPDDMKKDVVETKNSQSQGTTKTNNANTAKTNTTQKTKSSKNAELNDTIKIEVVGTNVHNYNISDYREKPQIKDEWAAQMIAENHIKVGSTYQNKGYGDKNTIHIVAKGETLQSIAKKYGIRTTDLINWNKIDVLRVRVGQELIINQPRYELDLFERNSVDQKEINQQKEVESIVEEGLVYFDHKAKFIGVLHPSLPVGKTIRITNKENFLTTYARVTGRLPNYENKAIIISIDRRIADELKINNPTVKVRVSYGKIEKLID